MIHKKGTAKSLEAPYILAPGTRSECLPEGEARGGDFALSEIPHSYYGLYPDAKVFKISDRQCVEILSLNVR